MKNQKSMLTKNIFFLVFVLVFSLAVPRVFAREFDKNNIITDEDIGKYDSMSKGYISEFLKNKGSGLAGLIFATNEGEKTAADLFYEAAHAYKINPKLLIVTAQKEQSAITDSDLSENQKEKLMGYGVFPGSDPSEYLGVHNQIKKSAWQFRRYIDLHENYTHQKGKTTTTNDGAEITPENRATAGLYNYTPYVGGENGIGGNYLFWSIWKDWFEHHRPSGSLIRQEGAPGVFLLMNEKKYAFWYRGVFEARKFETNDVVEISSTEMDGYPTVGPVKFDTGTLIRSPGGTVYIIDNAERRGFAHREVFDALGYSMDSVFDANWGEVNLYPEGEKIDGQDAKHANGTLMRSPKNGAIFLLWDGVRRPIIDRSIFERNFYWKNVIDVSIDVFNQYPIGEKVRFRDGTLMRSPNGTVFVIENGMRRQLASPSVFSGFGYQMENAINVSDKVIEIHPEGEILDTF